ncbi:antirestriction protein ArdA [Desulfovibrio piger]|jgi:hypothetical protein|uniref:antirestriction protein ArdA n=1 Tax=Desulfovibrio piger TaxID=901 RepID=UPI0039964944
MPTNTNSSDTFRIYVASLSDYNAGILHGTWIDFAQLTDLDDLRAAIAAMLATSPTAKAAPGQPAEEWMMPHSSFPICSATHAPPACHRRGVHAYHQREDGAHEHNDHSPLRALLSL